MHDATFLESARPRPFWLRGAVIVDGTGADGYVGDVLVDRGRIARIATHTVRHDTDVASIDADGLVLTPGFIDVHSHADCSPLLSTDDSSKLSQGVTTEVVGNCGFSLAPCPATSRDDVQQMMECLFPSVEYDWTTVESSYKHLDSKGYVTNSLPLVGHHTLRAALLGSADRDPTEYELEALKSELQRALDAGAGGLSSGLAYAPGGYATPDELTALAGVLGPDHIYATHLRSEGPSLIESIEEALGTARRSGARLQISHLKSAGRRAHGTAPSILEMLDAATEEGIEVHHDVYPYEANSTMLAACLPPWFHDGGAHTVLERLTDPGALAAAEHQIKSDSGGWDNWAAGAGWEGILICSTQRHEYEGTTIADLATALDMSPFAAMVKVLRDNELKVWMSASAMDARDVHAFFLHPRGMVGSDGPPTGNGGKPHPRLHGTFTRVLGHYVRELGLLSMPEAIRKMTSLPAEVFGIPDRGVVAEGAVADLVLLDPLTVADRATFLDPYRLSSGIEHVFVNGCPSLTSGSATGRYGRRLEPGRKSGRTRSVPYST
ncbi:N-acyl-D-amino-acid deacylase family protein [Jatrophihabitans lederbergiae]|uniref:D-aminoacylase n=1 Tax=Jatrophihabitans lederbergiae TaxID=3075547 RepID=A0ABU2J8R0_9ACTN|nr:D-aminoacylase [Jatrophihabitans sp. DSM 44399]MDT0261024.1 D-aminoacylase [Jatrophihabitans sp. DSM 44399]